ncbi:energy transducer TonB [Maricaulis sp.]|uniref:energy transducer TonB n=1 Tax=Maricaulis sp. TaxID=1486257 RepID=UPI003519AE62
MSARTGLASLVALSAALHGLAGAGAWAGWTLFNASTSETEAASLRIALGTRGAAAGAQPAERAEPAPEPVAAPAPTTPSPAPPEPAPRARPEPAQRPAPAAEPQSPPEPAIEPAAPSQAVTADTAAMAPQTAGSAGISGSQDRPDAAQTSRADDAPGFAGSLQYDGLVLAALERAKRYPAMARQRGREGVTGIVFEIDRQGRVLDVRIAAPSGSRSLDRAALEQVHRAAPFPAAPAGSDWPSRRFATEIRFSLSEQSVIR